MTCFRQRNTTVWPQLGYHAISDFPATAIGYPRSHVQVHPWSARRISLICVAKLNMDILLNHLTRPKGFIFPTPTAPRSNSAPPEYEWIPGLVTSAQVSALYQQEPWSQYPSQVTPVSFHETGWFA